MQVKLLTELTASEIRQTARSAANMDEALDTANVFSIGTDEHAVFTTEYLSQLSALEEAAYGLQIPCSVVCLPIDQGHVLGIPVRKGTGICGP